MSVLSVTRFINSEYGSPYTGAQTTIPPGSPAFLGHAVMPSPPRHERRWIMWLLRRKAFWARRWHFRHACSFSVLEILSARGRCCKVFAEPTGIQSHTLSPFRCWVVAVTFLYRHECIAGQLFLCAHCKIPT